MQPVGDVMRLDFVVMRPDDLLMQLELLKSEFDKLKLGMDFLKQQLELPNIELDDFVPLGRWLRPASETT